MPKRKNKAEQNPATEIPPNFLPVAAAFSGDPHVTQKRMFSSGSVLSVHKTIFAMLVKGRLVVKLPKERVDALVREGFGENFDPGHGRLMKEWVAVEAGTASWVELAREAYRFVTGKRFGGPCV